MHYSIETNIKFLKGIGEKRAQLLNKLGVFDFGTLLHFYPRSYQDWSSPLEITGAPIEKICCIKAYVATIPHEVKIRKGLTLYKFKIGDGLYLVDVTIFNNKYLAQKINLGEEYLFYGKLTKKAGKLQINSPLIKDKSSNKIIPIYRQTEGLNTRIISNAVLQVLDVLGDSIIDNIPQNVRKEHDICNIKFALQNIHFPKNYNDYDIARERLIFEEFFLMQCMIKYINKYNFQSTKFILNDYSLDEIIKKAPFKPTSAQIKAIEESIKDLKSGKQMNRLLQGDVGSGKTFVAAALCYFAAKNKWQCVIMAPTEILANQHYMFIKSLYNDKEINIKLLTASQKSKNKKKIKENLSSGEIDILVGTHALLQEDVNFSSLGLIITDEQHKFGVQQRAELYSKGLNPHILTMSATPIPRSLALLFYMDSSISILNELPPGRQKIETFFISSNKRNRAFNYIKKHIDEGYQGYIICPLVEDTGSDLVSVTEYYNELKNNQFKDYNIGFIHGKLKANEKEEIMQSFKNNEISLLIATTVIEVGIDVPKAAIIMIENAERFGLAQLHQLRGRVGRGDKASICILLSDAQNEEALKRFDILCKTNDGFKIAEQDLIMRGAGDFFGTEQHGLPDLKIADFNRDFELLKKAKETANKIFEKDYELNGKEYNLLKLEIERKLKNNKDTTFA